jgi:hypothetical protein
MIVIATVNMVVLMFIQLRVCDHDTSAFYPFGSYHL